MGSRRNIVEPRQGGTGGMEIQGAEMRSGAVSGVRKQKKADRVIGLKVARCKSPQPEKNVNRFQIDFCEPGQMWLL